MACANPPPAHGGMPVLCNQLRKQFSCDSSASVYCPSEIAKKFKHTVVQLDIVPAFDLYPEAVTDAGTPEARVFEQLRRVPMKQNGFFIEGGYIISSSAWLKYLFDAVVNYRRAVACLPADIGAPLSYDPQLTTPVIRTILGLFGGQTCFNGVSMSGSFVDLFSIHVTVTRVNTCDGANFVYRAFLLGFDPATGVAVYKIAKTDPANKCVPCLSQVPALKFGDSCTYGVGNPAHVSGTWLGVNPHAFSSGVVTDNSVMDRKGLLGYEGLATSIPAGLGVVGAPILNQCAQVIGMATGLTEQGTVFGVSSNFMMPIICSLIAAHRNSGKESTEHATYSNVFNTFMYEHGTLNIKYAPVTGSELGLRIPSNLSASTAPVIPGVEGASCSLNDCRALREPIGILLSEVCGCSAQACTTVECPASINNVTLVGQPSCETRIIRMAPGDIITHIDGKAIGLYTGLSLETVLYNRCCGDEVRVTFLKLVDNYRTAYTICVTLESSLDWVRNVSEFINIGDGASTAFIYANMVDYFFHLLPGVEKSEFLTDLAYKSLAITNSVTQPIPFLPPPAPAPTINPTYARHLYAQALRRGGIPLRGAVEYVMDLNGVQLIPTSCPSLLPIMDALDAYVCLFGDAGEEEAVPEP